MPRAQISESISGFRWRKRVEAQKYSASVAGQLLKGVVIDAFKESTTRELKSILKQFLPCFQNKEITIKLQKHEEVQKKGNLLMCL